MIKDVTKYYLYRASVGPYSRESHKPIGPLGGKKLRRREVNKYEIDQARSSVRVDTSN